MTKSVEIICISVPLQIWGTRIVLRVIYASIQISNTLHCHWFIIPAFNSAQTARLFSSTTMKYGEMDIKLTRQLELGLSSYL